MRTGGRNAAESPNVLKDFESGLRAKQARAAEKSVASMIRRIAAVRKHGAVRGIIKPDI